MGKNAIIFMGPPAFNEVCMSEAPITDTDHVDAICLKVVATSKMRIFIAKNQSQRRRRGRTAAGHSSVTMFCRIVSPTCLLKLHPSWPNICTSPSPIDI